LTEIYTAFGVPDTPRHSKREMDSPRLERYTNQNPPNARQLPHVWSTNASKYARTKKAAPNWVRLED